MDILKKLIEIWALEHDVEIEVVNVYEKDEEI